MKYNFEYCMIFLGGAFAPINCTVANYFLGIVEAGGTIQQTQ